MARVGGASGYEGRGYARAHGYVRGAGYTQTQCICPLCGSIIPGSQGHKTKKECKAARKKGKRS